MTVVDEAAIRPEWDSRIPEPEWLVYQRVIRGARQAEIPFAFGGAFATAVYTGELRNTKDFDFYITLRDLPAMTEAITRAGLQDHYEQLPYDRQWIYRASTGDVIVDAIWTMANQRAPVDEHWLMAGPEVMIRGERMRAIPIEELIWSKLYVLQRDRTDWDDVLKLIDARAGEIDWNHLLDRLAEDAPLLAGALAVYGWLAPEGAAEISGAVWNRLGLRLPRPAADPGVTSRRAALLDGRPWFRPRDQ
jgi:hypothetical protein